MSTVIVEVKDSRRQARWERFSEDEVSDGETSLVIADNLSSVDKMLDARVLVDGELTRYQTPPYEPGQRVWHLLPCGDFMAMRFIPYLGGYLLGETHVEEWMFRAFQAHTKTAMPWRTGRKHQPATDVSLCECEAFAQWAGLSVQTEDQYEAEATALGTRKYPWGDDRPDDFKLVWSGNRERSKPENVGSKPLGSSIHGCLDMVGNVWQLTDTTEDSDILVIRGGGWLDYLPVGVRAAYRHRNVPANRFVDVGFRCARNDYVK